jgi:hypothetical protein
LNCVEFLGFRISFDFYCDVSGMCFTISLCLI